MFLGLFYNIISYDNLICIVSQEQLVSSIRCSAGNIMIWLYVGKMNEFKCKDYIAFCKHTLPGLILPDFIRTDQTFLREHKYTQVPFECE